MGRYVILVRHASRDFNSNHDESKQAMSRWDPCLERVVPCFKVKGLPRTLAIAHRLAVFRGVLVGMRQIKVTRIWHVPTMSLRRLRRRTSMLSMLNRRMCVQWNPCFLSIRTLDQSRP
jgi:hypothetical protein